MGERCYNHLTSKQLLSNLEVLRQIYTPLAPASPPLSLATINSISIFSWTCCANWILAFLARGEGGRVESGGGGTAGGVEKWLFYHLLVLSSRQILHCCLLSGEDKGSSYCCWKREREVDFDELISFGFITQTDRQAVWVGRGKLEGARPSQHGPIGSVEAQQCCKLLFIFDNLRQFYRKQN